MRVLQTIRRVRNRRLFVRAVRGGAIGLCAGLGLALLVLLLDRLAWITAPWQLRAVLAAAGMVVGAVVAAVVRRPASLDLAVELDRRLGLRDRLGTAIALTGRRRFEADPDFAALAVADAERQVDRINVAASVPIRVTAEWVAAAAMVIVLVLVAALVPRATREPEADAVRAALAETPMATPEAVDHVATPIDDTLEEVRDDPELSEAVAEQLTALDDLAEQLAGETPPPEPELDDLREQSAAEMEELADRIAEEAERDLAAADELAERFRAIQPADAPMTTEELLDALREGEYAEAAQRLQELLDGASEMTEEERQQAAEELRDLADLVEEMEQWDESELRERAAQLEQALRDQGVDEETIRELLDQADAEDQPEGAPEDDPLAEEPLDPEQAERLARDLRELQEQRRTDEQTRRDAEQVSDALNDAAEQLEENVETSEENVETSEENVETSKRRNVETDGGQEDEPGEEQRPEQKPGSEQQQEPGGEKQQQQQPGGEQPQQKPGGEQLQQQPGGEQPQQKPGGEQPQQKPGGDQPQQQPGGEQPQPGPEGEAGEPGAREGRDDRAPAERLRDIERRRRSAEERRRLSERLRQRARDVAEGRPPRADETPTARSPGAGEGTAPPEQRDTERPQFDDRKDVEVGGDEPSDRVIAEWLDEGTPGDPAAEGTAAPPRTRRVRQAQEVAERAVNESTVPSRYHRLIKEYFQRLDKTVEKASDEGD